MKKKIFWISLIFVCVAELVALTVFAIRDTDDFQDAVAVNEVLQSVKNNWDTEELFIEDQNHQTELDYVVLDGEGRVLFRTRTGLSESINEAVIHRDTILDIEKNGSVLGKLIVYNDGVKTLKIQRQKTVLFLGTAILLQWGICIGYIFCLNQTIIKPFHKLKGFAERIAGGNLDIPLEMDRGNLFGAFTEAFDMMRFELKKARIAEAEANASKKELVAKLSHDIKTPVASIKAASEVGAALADDEKARENYMQIIHKADQINTLITNLFTSTLEELQQISITSVDMESQELKTMLECSDYLHRAVIPHIPECLIYGDRLRLQQVFDNIFANSYKYADTKIDVTVCKDQGCLTLSIQDYGGGVSEEELPILKEKFRRGNNTEKIEGAGLGLYISDYFMKEMKGELLVGNGQNGLEVTVRIPLSGMI